MKLELADANRRRRWPRKLVRESKWLRVYEVKPNVFKESSKLLEDGLELDPDEFDRTWPQLSPRERLDVCAAYRAKRQLSNDDERILNIIMERGDEVTWSNIASVLARHTDRGRVLSFLRDRIQEQHTGLANLFQTAETLGDKSSVPLLLEKYHGYRNIGLSPECSDQRSCVDYLACCKALWKLTGSAQYRKAIEEFIDTESKLLRDTAKRLLGQPRVANT